MNETIAAFDFSTTPATTRPGPPKHSLSDYFVLILLSICIAIGAPMTLMICWRLMQRLRLTGAFRCNRKLIRNGSQKSSDRRSKTRPLMQAQGSTTSLLAQTRRTDLLKLQLNVADLMVLIFYAFSKVIWTLTYNWRGGEALCKLVRFLSVLSFHMCSNSVVCMGLDRMITLLKPTSSRGCRYKKCCAREFLMLAVSCASAVLCSLPQFWIWTVREVFPNWHQCVNVWAVAQGEMTESQLTWFEVYNVFHLLTIFWIPCTIIAVAYIVIVVQVLLHLKEPSVEGNIRNPTQSDSESRENMRASASATHRIKIGKGWMRCGRLTRFLCRQSLTILTVYIFCWSPYNALTLWIYFKPQHAYIYSTMVRFLQELIVVNSVINPFLYACDVYHQIVDERTRQDPHTCLCCFFSCPCALVEDSDGESAEEL